MGRRWGIMRYRYGEEVKYNGIEVWGGGGV